MVGTIFLWMFWPSFNAAITSTPDGFNRAVVNTLISITGSSISAFVTSYVVRKQKKFNILHIQNATLAGGVAMGAAADLALTPGGALAVGFAAGILSVVGYNSVQSRLERSFGITDTCGILNLHGMPGVLGGLVSVITCALLSYDTLLLQVDSAIASGMTGRNSASQALYQFCYLIITLVISIISGFLTGILIRNLDPIRNDNYFDDSALWEVPEEEGQSGHLSRADVEKIVKELTAVKKLA
jgi:ammonium transporter Rh